MWAEISFYCNRILKVCQESGGCVVRVTQLEWGLHHKNSEIRDKTSSCNFHWNNSWMKSCSWRWKLHLFLRSCVFDQSDVAFKSFLFVRLNKISPPCLNFLPVLKHLRHPAVAQAAIDVHLTTESCFQHNRHWHIGKFLLLWSRVEKYVSDFSCCFRGNCCTKKEAEKRQPRRVLFFWQTKKRMEKVYF